MKRFDHGGPGTARSLDRSAPRSAPRRAAQAVRRGLRAGLFEMQFALLWTWFRIMGPPRLLLYHEDMNLRLLRAFGARVGCCRVLAPVTLHYSARTGYGNLTIGDGCVLAGNNFLDLLAPITLEPGVSLGPGVVVMTHNVFNRNPFLTAQLPELVGREPVVIGAGADIRPNAVILHGTEIGENAVVAGNSVVRSSVPSRAYVGGAPAEVRKDLTASAEASRVPRAEHDPSA